MSNHLMHYESFEAAFTGELVTHFSDKLKLGFGFKKPYIKIHKGHRYMFVYDTVDKVAKLLPIFMPDPTIHL